MKFKLNKKRIYYAASVLMIAIIIVGGIIYLIRKPESAAAWFNDDWYYRQSVPLTNAGSALTDYQISITLDTATLITAGKMQSDCDDIRLADAQGNILSYWIEEGNPGCNSATTKIWTKVSSIPVGSSTIYLYYGNQSAVNGQDGNDVFLLFHNYNALPGDWTTEGTNTGSATWAINSSALRASYLCCSLYSSYTKNNSNFSNFIIDVRWKYSGTSHGGLVFRGQSNSANNSYQWIFRPPQNTSRIQKRVNTTQTYPIAEQSVGTISADTWYNLSLKAIGTQITGYINGSQVLTGDMGDTTYTTGKVGIQHYDGTNDFDNFRVRQAVATEPTIGSLGSEEKGLAPILHYRLDEGSGTTTKSSTSRTNDATISGATWQKEDQCISGKCLYFDGTNDYVYGASNLGLSGNAELTMEAWIKWTDTSWSGNYPSAMGNNTTSSLAGLSMTFNSGRPALDFWVTRYRAASALSLNTWYHIAVTKTAGNVSSTSKIYVNGVEVSGALENTDGSPNITDSIPIIGRLDGTRWFKGYIDDVRYYNYARSAAQVKQDYTSSKAGASSEIGANATMGSSNQKWLSDGLVGYWKMDESSWTNDCSTATLLDSSGNVNTGKACPATTGPTSGTIGKYGNGGAFDGSNDYVDIADSNSLDFNNVDFSLSFWVKLGELSNVSGVIAKNPSGNAGGSNYAVWKNTDDVYFYIGTGTAGQYDSVYASNLIQNEWTHLLATFEANTHTLKMYQNGVLVNTRVTTIDPGANSGVLGFANLGGGGYFNGGLDEVRIYNRLLSAQEAFNLSQYAPGPLAYWKLDDNTGTSVTDSSGNGYNSSSFTTPVWTVGKRGSALNFDGNDIVEFTYSGTLPALTVGAWIYPTNVSGWKAIFQTSGTGDRAFYVRDGYLHFYNGTTTCNSSLAVSTNQWQYATMTIDSSDAVKYYLNGSPAGGCAGGANARVATYWHLSGQTTGDGENFLGKIDDVKLYNYVLSSKQIIEDMTNGGLEPLAQWNFDEPRWAGTSGEVKDATNRGRNGTAQGGVTTSAGKYGRAGEYLDGGDFITTTGNLSTLDGVSMSAWIYPTDRTYETIAHIGNQAVTSFHWLYLSGSNITWQYSNGSAYIVKNGSYSMPLNQWSHLVVTHDYIGKTVKYYVDGDLVATQTHTDTVSPITDKTVTIGAYAANDGVFSGKIDELKIYSFALNADDVKKDFNQGGAVRTGGITEAGDTGSGPIGWWKLDDNTGTTAVDASGNNNTATFSSVPLWKAGKIGSALKFDGVDDRLTIGNGMSASITTSLTISFWVKPLTSGHNGAETYNYDVMVGKHASGVSSDIGIGYRSDNKIRIYVENASTSDYLDSTVAIPISSWTYVTAVANGSKYQLYLNGIYDGEKTFATNFVIDKLGIGGADLTTWSTYLNGYIDDVKVYNYARTQAQIAYDYNRGKPAAYWALDEGSGSVARDFSGNGNSGTITIGGSGAQTTVTQAWTNGESGKFGKSLKFDGTDDYVQITESVSVKPNYISVGTWFKVVDKTAAQRIISKTENGSYQISLNENSTCTSSTLCFLVNITGVGYRAASYATSNFSNNTWYHVMGTYDGTDVKLYFNGNLVNTTNQVGTGITHSSVPFCIGSEATTGTCAGGAYFNGQIDEVRIYGYALTAEQVKQAMIQGGGARY